MLECSRYDKSDCNYIVRKWIGHAEMNDSQF